jgi:hypothetical protein
MSNLKHHVSKSAWLPNELVDFRENFATRIPKKIAGRAVGSIAKDGTSIGDGETNQPAGSLVVKKRAPAGWVSART